MMIFFFDNSCKILPVKASGILSAVEIFLPPLGLDLFPSIEKVQNGSYSVLAFL